MRWIFVGLVLLVGVATCLGFPHDIKEKDEPKSAKDKRYTEVEKQKVIILICFLIFLFFRAIRNAGYIEKQFTCHT